MSKNWYWYAIAAAVAYYLYTQSNQTPGNPASSGNTGGA
jgi:hypothetical protein